MRRAPGRQLPDASAAAAPRRDPKRPSAPKSREAPWRTAMPASVACSAATSRPCSRSTYVGMSGRRLNCLTTEYLTLKGSFSAVSKLNFASKYALESSRRDLQSAILCTALKSQFLSKNCHKIANFCKMQKKKETFLKNVAKFGNSLANF